MVMYKLNMLYEMNIKYIYIICVSLNQRSSIATEERDVYEELLTQQEIQGCLDLVNGKDFPSHLHTYILTYKGYVLTFPKTLSSTMNVILLAQKKFHTDLVHMNTGLCEVSIQQNVQLKKLHKIDLFNVKFRLQTIGR